MNKYLAQTAIKPNHWYEDDKGNVLIYLGMAAQDNGYWSYPKCHIYMKANTLKRHFHMSSNTDLNTLHVSDMLNTMAELGVRHLCFSKNPRKFVAETGTPHPDEPLHGHVGIFDFD